MQHTPNSTAMVRNVYRWVWVCMVAAVFVCVFVWEDVQWSYKRRSLWRRRRGKRRSSMACVGVGEVRYVTYSSFLCVCVVG